MTQSKSNLLRSLRLISPVLVLAVLIFSLMHHKSDAKPKGAPEKITLALNGLPYGALAQVALARGYFEEEGLQVTPLTFSFGRLALQSVIEGKADFATVAETPLVFAVMSGADLSVVATIHSSSKSHGILALKEKGVLLPGDLRGKTIATPLRTSAHFFLDVYLVAHGIPLEEVKVVDLRPEELLDVLQQGKADAACVFDPFVTMARRQLDDAAVCFYDEDIYRLTFNVVGRTEYVKRNPATVRKVLRALVKAQEFVALHPREAQETVAQVTRLDRDLVEQSWQGASFRVGLDQSLVLALEDESRWAAAHFFPGAPLPNYLRNLYLEGLEAVKPGAVQILR